MTHPAEWLCLTTLLMLKVRSSIVVTGVWVLFTMEFRFRKHLWKLCVQVSSGSWVCVSHQWPAFPFLRNSDACRVGCLLSQKKDSTYCQTDMNGPNNNLLLSHLRLQAWFVFENIFYGDKIKDDDNGWAYSTHGEMKNEYQTWLWFLNGIGHSEDLIVHERIILKCILER